MKPPAFDFDWNQARAFLATAEEGSLSAASRALGLTQPTLGRQVAAFEEKLGVALFERVGRSLSLTPTGRDLLPHVKAMGAAAEELTLTATGRSQAMTGTVAISVVDAVAVTLMPPILERLQAEAPGLIIDLVITDSLSDLRRREADIAIRHVRPEDPDLIARKVRERKAALYATPEFRDRHGGLRSVADLAGVPIIAFDDIDRMMSDFGNLGLDPTPDQFRVIARSGAVGWDLVRRGFGVGAMIDDVAEHFTDVVPVCEDFTPIPVPYWLTVHRELRTSARIRRVFDILADALAP
ncbi:LysR family transcriptional regulator [Pseudaestuariivita atlantica]|uniref:LysR family transcriptional regulator n=1 Tax=Pseudaestuariivita atlantica TaxID=1317121 RepID=A0A0L1JND3_9RHOB|nr:LysR family transcriptional regulator [Pseudaestuariivita atlantica]KNG93222.1 LysR family transcriptional regulator [Pseudaestuariivita atlantica]